MSCACSKKSVMQCFVPEMAKLSAKVLLTGKNVGKSAVLLLHCLHWTVCTKLDSKTKQLCNNQHRQWNDVCANKTDVKTVIKTIGEQQNHWQNCPKCTAIVMCMHQCKCNLCMFLVKFWKISPVAVRNGSKHVSHNTSWTKILVH